MMQYSMKHCSFPDEENEDSSQEKLAAIAGKIQPQPWEFALFLPSF